MNMLRYRGELIRAIALVALILVPLVMSDFHTLVIGVKALWIGIAGASA